MLRRFLHVAQDLPSETDRERDVRKRDWDLRNVAADAVAVVLTLKPVKPDVTVGVTVDDLCGEAVAPDVEERSGLGDAEVEAVIGRKPLGVDLRWKLGGRTAVLKRIIQDGIAAIFGVGTSGPVGQLAGERPRVGELPAGVEDELVGAVVIGGTVLRLAPGTPRKLPLTAVYPQVCGVTSIALVPTDLR